MKRLPSRTSAGEASLQPHSTGLGLQVALVVAGAGIASGRTALVTLGVARVQRLLHAAPHHPVEVVLYPIVVDRDDIVPVKLGVVSVMAALLGSPCV